MSSSRSCLLLDLALGGCTLSLLAGMLAAKQLQQAIAVAESASDLLWDEKLPELGEDSVPKRL